MRGIIVTITFLLAGVLGADAQDELPPFTSKGKIDWGQYQDVHKQFSVEGVVGSDGTHFYVLTKEKSDYYISKYTHDSKLVLKVELDMMYEKKSQTYEFMVMHNDRLFLFTSFINNKTKKNFLFREEVSTSTLTSDKKLNKLAEIPFVKRKSTGYYSYRTSLDDSKLLIYYRLVKENEPKANVAAIVFDENMNEMWKRTIRFPLENDMFGLSSVAVGNDGNIYVAGREFPADVKGKSRKWLRDNAQFKYQVYAISEAGNMVRDFELGGDDMTITDLALSIDDQNNLVAAGFYSEKGRSSIKGSIFMRVEVSTGRVLKTSRKEFPRDFIMEGWSDKAVAKANKKEAKSGKEPEMYEYDLSDFIIRDDGGCILVAEQYFMRVVTHTTTNANGGVSTRTTYHYHFNDIIIVNVSPEGQIEWNSRIPKRQYSVNDFGRRSSYGMTVVGDKIYFLFNDDPDNIDRDPDEKLNSAKLKTNSMLTLVQVSPDGSTTREAFHYNSYLKGDICCAIPQLAHSLEDNRLLLVALQKKLVAFGVASFE